MAATEAADRARMERQMSVLLAELDVLNSLLVLAAIAAERGFMEKTLGVVYPVWFGTNRKPAANGITLTHARHNRTILGRLLVHAPEAHRFGETGSGFWKRLLHFDLRDDRLRIQSVEPRERDTFFAELHDAMKAARDTGETPHALFYLHGFNVTFWSRNHRRGC